MADDMTIGELSRLVAELKKDIREDFAEVRAQIAALHYVHVDVYAADRAADAERLRAVTDRLDRLESSAQWLARTVAGIVLAALIGGLFAAAHLGA